MGLTVEKEEVGEEEGVMRIAERVPSFQQFESQQDFINE